MKSYIFFIEKVTTFHQNWVTTFHYWLLREILFHKFIKQKWGCLVRLIIQSIYQCNFWQFNGFDRWEFAIIDNPLHCIVRVPATRLPVMTDQSDISVIGLISNNCPSHVKIVRSGITPLPHCSPAQALSSPVRVRPGNEWNSCEKCDTSISRNLPPAVRSEFFSSLVICTTSTQSVHSQHTVSTQPVQSQYTVAGGYFWQIT